MVKLDRVLDGLPPLDRHVWHAKQVLDRPADRGRRQHEVGHHVQNLIGINRQVAQAQQRGTIIMG